MQKSFWWWQHSVRYSLPLSPPPGISVPAGTSSARDNSALKKFNQPSGWVSRRGCLDILFFFFFRFPFFSLLVLLRPSILLYLQLEPAHPVIRGAKQCCQQSCGPGQKDSGGRLLFSAHQQCALNCFLQCSTLTVRIEWLYWSQHALNRFLQRSRSPVRVEQLSSAHPVNSVCWMAFFSKAH